MRQPLHGLPTTMLGELVARTRLRQQDPQLLHPTSSSREEKQCAEPLKSAGGLAATVISTSCEVRMVCKKSSAKTNCRLMSFFSNNGTAHVKGHFDNLFGKLGRYVIV